jgi:hypothetical protein
VILDLGGVVENTTRLFLNDFLKGQVFELGALDQVIKVGHVTLAVLAISVQRST